MHRKEFRVWSAHCHMISSPCERWVKVPREGKDFDLAFPVLIYLFQGHTLEGYSGVCILDIFQYASLRGYINLSFVLQQETTLIQSGSTAVFRYFHHFIMHFFCMCKKWNANQFGQWFSFQCLCFILKVVSRVVSFPKVCYT